MQIQPLNPAERYWFHRDNNKADPHKNFKEPLPDSFKTILKKAEHDRRTSNNHSIQT